MRADHSRRKSASGFRFIWISALAVMGTLPAAVAEEDNVDQQSQAYQASMTQGDVQRDAKAIQAQLVELREQMRQLMPKDVATVDAAIKKMQTLSQDEMEKAIAALQSASQSKDPAAQIAQIAGAVQTQGNISNELKSVAVDLKMRETLASIGSELSALVRREAGVYSEIKRLGKMQQSPNQLRGQSHERYDLANEDQKGVTADLNLLGKRIDTLTKDITDDTKNGLVQAATVAQEQKLAEAADKAAALTVSGPLNDATTAQVQVIQILVAMEQALSAGSDPIDRIRGLADRLKQAGSDEKSVVDAVMLIGERQAIDRGFRQMQSGLTDEVVAMQFELQPVNNQAAGLLAPAEEASNRSLANFERMWEEHMDARVNTQNALKSIDAAYQLLAQQIARAELNQPQNAAELAKALEDLARQVAQAAMDQARVAQQPSAQPQQQAAMEAKVGDYQQQALPISPEAANSLAQAGTNLQNSAQQSQQQAAQNLAQAAQQLAQQAQAAQQLANAQAQVAAAQAQTAAAQQALAAGQTPQADAQMAAAQQNAAAAEQNAQAAAPEAGQNLDQAQAELGQGQAAAAPADAAAAAEAAAAALAAAADGLRTAAGKMPGMGQGGTQVSEMPEDQGPNSPNNKGNGGGGKSGDDLMGAGANSGPVEVLDGLNPKDRDAIALLQTEKPPREFVPQVQQYYKNIADGAGL